MVNTFVVSRDVRECARALDWRRLGKQRVEAVQIYKALTDEQRRGWSNHPATLMWKGHEDALAMYANAMIDHWIERGYKNTMPRLPHEPNPAFPWWWTYEPLAMSHRASLNRKDPTFYHFDVPEEWSQWGYVWPSKLDVEKAQACAEGQLPPPAEVCVPIAPPLKRKRGASPPEPPGASRTGGSATQF